MTFAVSLFLSLCFVVSLMQYQKLRECEGISDPDQRVKSLQTCQIMFKTTPALEKDARYVEEYLKLTKKQKQIEVCEVVLQLLEEP